MNSLIYPSAALAVIMLAKKFKEGALNIEIDTLSIRDIIHMRPLHPVWNKDKVNQLVKSLQNKGWVGRPLIYAQFGDDPNNCLRLLATGTHRQAALEKLNDEAWDNDEVMWNGKMVEENEFDEIRIPVINLADHLSEDALDEFFNLNDDDDRIAFLSKSGIPEEIVTILEMEQT